MSRCRAVLAVAAGLTIAAAPAWAEKKKVGEERAYDAETSHPYAQGAGHRPVVWSQAVVSPGAEFVRVHFGAFKLAPGDFVTVADPQGETFWTYAGDGPKGTGQFWSFAVEGDTAVVELHAGSQPGHGFRIDRIAHGTESISGKRGEPTPEVVCDTDGREDVACHASINTNPVARLLFQSGGSTFACTGWLVAGSNANTMVTNNHCFDTQAETDTVQAKFGYQRSGCNSGSIGSGTDYTGGTFLRTNTERRKGRKGGLDYTLLTLDGNPSATWGQYTASSKSMSVGDLIFFPQHPGGNEKEIGYWEDAAQTVRCKVDTVNQTYGQSATGSQTGYGCDSIGGSSGSPILDAGTGRVVALHHYGGVTSSPCLNSGTAMSRVCADAGSLLSCASN